jgi:thioredoxin-like negative regulator of GroEL
LSVVVDDPAAELKTISAMAENMGGFVVSSNLFQSFTPTGEEVPSASITIRVPVERLAEALERIEGRANSVTSRTESGQDVTAQYTDLQSRLRNLEDAEELLREIMEEARDTEDVLVAFNQLNSITEQIEVLKGQIQYYEESAALSAINVQLTASAAAQPVTIGSWEPKGVALDAIRALVRALQGIADAAIWLTLYVLPILLVLAIPIWLVWRAVRRRQANRPAAKS